MGLAAPQIGVGRKWQLLILMMKQGTIEMINPVILETTGEQIGPEGCLSFPGFFGEVKRANYVKINAQDRKGKILFIRSRGFFSKGNST